MAVRIQGVVGGKKKTNPNLRDRGYSSSMDGYNSTSKTTSPASADRGRPRDDTRPKDWSPYGGNNTSSKKTNSNLRDRGYPSSTNPTSQPKKTTTSSNANRGYPHSTAPTSQPKNTEAAIRMGFEKFKENPKSKKTESTSHTISRAMRESVFKPGSNAEAMRRGASGESLRAKGDGKRYVSGSEYKAYQTGKNKAQKNDEASRITEAQRRAAAGEPLRAKGEEKRYVSQAEYNAYQTAKAKAKKKGR